ncbi:uncharacterized protein LOC124450628 [Xenia sp. Carnegie-2017]|uniref:uncharacterized protein LOC124450628 n=1 Tax=Xenia sp. Carnegie-2017 TaxID=2897299 RepID=UPI001F0491FD|nr:uncharacterized protein LOC124450628 [Xenia sp. Carnegie-2017]
MTTSISRSIANGSVVVGVIELVAASVSVVVGIFAMSTYSGHSSSSAGIWVLECLIPGTLSIIAGRTKNIAVFSFALFFNIVGTVVSSVAALLLFSFWTILVGSGCNHVQYGFDCAVHHKVYAIVVILAVMMIILASTSFIGCIIGCFATCCINTTPVIITSVPAQTSTIIVTSQTCSQHSQSYHPMTPQNVNGSITQAYTGVPVQAFGFQTPCVTDDEKALINNIVL